MHQNFIELSNGDLHTEEVEDIISSPPSWLLRWGITSFLGMLVMIFGLSAYIHYPDTIKTELTIYSLNSPKPVIAKVAGKVMKLLVADNQIVNKGQSLAFMESLADHDEVLRLLADCKTAEKIAFISNQFNVNTFSLPTNLHLGEIQDSYQIFYESYITYKSSINDGFFLKKRNYLQNDLRYISRQDTQLQQQKTLQKRDFTLADEEFQVHRKLADEKVETSMELKQEESKFINRKSPLIQTESELITNRNNFSNKQREIIELDNQITEQKEKFLQSLNSLISDIEAWKSKYILSAPEAGKLSYVGIIQENEQLNINQNVFYINSGNEHYFGQVEIPQNNMGKIKVGQTVLIKLRSYPYEEYGIITAKLVNISDIPLKDSVFIGKVMFDMKSFSHLKKGVHLGYGMSADAEIITENASLLSRLYHNLVKNLR